MPSIEFSQLSKTFPNGFHALKEVNFSVEDGEFLALIGPSGCGKTTLLRILAGLETPTSGTIRVDNKEIIHLEPNERNIGMVFQNYALFPHLSTFQNMSFGLKAQKVSTEETQAKVHQVAQRLEIKDFLERKPHQLSGGQRQRVALGRLLVKNPSIHLLDEPLSNLDANLRNLMRDELRKLHLEHQNTTLFVTHDQVEAMTLGQRICVMNNGSIEQIGSPGEIYQNPANQFVAEFFGSPPINLIRGNLTKKENSEFIFQGEGYNFDLPAKWAPSKTENLILGIRPEDLKICSDPNTAPQTSNQGQVSHIDELGDCKIIHLKEGNFMLSIKCPSSDEISDKLIKFEVNWSKVHWFDRTQGHRIN